VEIQGIVYEKDLKLDDAEARGRVGPGVPIAVANQMRDTFKAALMTSRVDAENRYASGMRLAQTNFAMTTLTSLVNTEKLTLQNVGRLPRPLSSKLEQIRPDVSLHQLLAMPFQMQKELFDLKRAITGMAHKVTNPKRKWLTRKDQEQLFRRRSDSD
jgi:hypothetical protein